MDILNITILASSSIIDQITGFPWGRMGIILLIIYLILCLYAWFFADYLIFPAPRKPGYDKDDSVFYLDTASGDQIACKYWQPQDQAKGTILYSHGNAEDIGRIEEVLTSWVEDGYSVIAYDYPGYGHSTGKPNEQGCYDAIDAVYRHLTKELQLSPQKIILWGRSLGTGPSCYLAEKEKTAGLLLETPFLSAYLTATEIPVVPWDRFRNLERAPNIKPPTLVIHGHKDEVVLFRHGKKFFNALPEPKKLLEFEHAGHNDLPEIGGTRYRDQINEFLQRVLGG
jgi:alpha-beta hydrolase superfamily lysophospholipase